MNWFYQVELYRGACRCLITGIRSHFHAIMWTVRSDIFGTRVSRTFPRERWDNEGTGTPSIISSLPSALVETAGYYAVDFPTMLVENSELVGNIGNVERKDSNDGVAFDNL